MIFDAMRENENLDYGEESGGAAQQRDWTASICMRHDCECPLWSIILTTMEDEEFREQRLALSDELAPKG